MRKMTRKAAELALLAMLGGTAGIALTGCEEGVMEETGEEIDDAVDDVGDRIDDATE